jgi:SAM-dependent methyltransferase
VALHAGRSVQVARLVAHCVQLDREWQGKIPEDDRRYAPWMAFSTPAFISMAAEALAWFADDKPGRTAVTALEIGCGPGPKMLLLRDLFGCDVAGFDRNAEYVAAARSLGLDASVADAQHYAGYGHYDLIWFNRVARDPQIQRLTEHRVWTCTAPGSAVMCANLEHPPPQHWIPVLDDWELRRGIWVKPRRAQ